MNSITSLLELDADFDQLMAEFDAGFEMANTIPPRSPEWHWRRRIVKNDLNILAGEQGLGKSHLGVVLAAVESHKGGPNDPHYTLILSGEEDKSTVIVPRLIALDADLSRVAIMNEDLGLLLTPEGMNHLYGYVVTCGATLVIIDPVTAFIGHKTDSYKDDNVRAVMRVLRAIAKKAGCTFILVMHTKKGQERVAVNMVGGSIGWTAAPRSVLIMTRDEAGERKTDRILWHPKCNVGPEQDPLACRIVPVEYDTLGLFETSYLDFTGEVADDADLDVALGHAPKPRTKLDEAKSWLREHLGVGPQDARGTEAMATVAGIKPGTLRRARESLNIRPQQTADGWIWTLPDA